MSDALAFLAKARPDAMGHYFAFLKQCGTRLDPKTRNLISVITKVHAQTERGLRQYVRRALGEGCSAAEILDALLMAFPALGLAKIVWATDVMLAMGLPEFAALAAPPAAPAQWHDIAPLDSVPAGETHRFERDGRGLFLHRAAEGWRAWDSRCPHQGTEMRELALDGAQLTCPGHGWRFDVRSGACTGQGDRRLHELHCRVLEGRVQAFW